VRSDIEIAGVETGEHLVAADAGTSLARTLAELARIDGTHATKPVCGLCGQRVITLDKHGLCSKVSNTHRAEREAGAA
jgi:hypothetical protein